ncbi:MAG: hypothetical protein ACOYUZ_01995 [Patescibacteria group bacterium]
MKPTDPPGDFFGFVISLNRFADELRGLNTFSCGNEHFKHLMMSLDLLQESLPNAPALQNGRFILVDFALSNWEEKFVAKIENDPKTSIAEPDEPKGLIVQWSDILPSIKRNLLGHHFPNVYTRALNLLERLQKTKGGWRNEIHNLENSLLRGQL